MPNQPTPKKIPAIDLPLTGQFLIEASAGTGKTWTLTGIVLRLLIEGNRPCEHIIATTFTRAAAAEMRERIRSRLIDFKRLLHVSLKMTANNHPLSADASLFNTMADMPNIKQLQQQIQQQPELAELLADPINLHLLTYLLDTKHTQTLADAFTRVNLALNTLDRLFINTLDSLCQKWLHEYSSETGYNQKVHISPHPQQFIRTIAHDELRYFQAELHSTQPQAYQLLQQQHLLSLTPAHFSAISTALNFNNAPIDTVCVSSFDFDGFKRLISSILQADSSMLEDFILPTGSQYHSLKGQLKNNGGQWHDVIAILKDFGIAASSQFNEKQHRFFAAIEKTDIIGSQFLKKHIANNALFNTLELVQLLKRYCTQQQQLNDYLQALQQQLVVKLCQAVREKLPVMLEQHQQTSFSLQLQRLNQALAGQTGQALARYIRHQYPVALIDESQDMNSDQAQLIERIYLANASTENSSAKKQHRGFLLLVGDPKQAIYGFRGGDVANYNALKQRFDPHDIHQLTINRRSNANIIASLNALFTQPRTENPLPNQLGQHIFYHQIEAARGDCHWFNSDGTKIYHTVNLLYIAAEDDINESVAKQIALLLNPQSPVYKQTSTGEKHPITLTDICVLGRARHNLSGIEKQLHHLGISTLKTSDVSVFADQMAQAMATVMQAMLHPFHLNLVNRALASPIFGFSQHDLHQLQTYTSSDNNEQFTENNCTIEDFHHLFATCNKQWQRYGFLSAWQRLMNSSICVSTTNANITEKTNLWQRLASQPTAERLLVDMRHILDTISTQAQGLGEHQLSTWLLTQLANCPTDDWALQQPLPSATGVQLMTMHKAKGLEFAIVFAVGLDASMGKTSNTQLYRYDAVTEVALKSNQVAHLNNTQPRHNNSSQQVTQHHTLTRRLSATPTAQGQQTHNIAEQYQQSQFEEGLRLSYVAFTRASELLYIVSKQTKKAKDYAPLNRWLTEYYDVPTQLQQHIHTVFSQQLSLANGFNYQLKQKQTLLPIEYAQPPQQTWFTGWRKTSFSAIARELNQSKQDSAVNEADYRTDIADDIENSTITTLESSAHNPQPPHEDNLPLRFRFTKGATAGSFLHATLEKLDIQHPNTWAATIENNIREFNMPINLGSSTFQQQQLKLEQPTQTPYPDNNDHQALVQWLTAIVNTPLSASGICLADINPNKRYPELGFNMGLSTRFESKGLIPLFARYNKPLFFNEAASTQLFKFMRGEIDLVYEHQQKFYVVDYKSNFLGTSWTDYQPQKLTEAMNHAGYWLQAAIYQVALHRLLRWRLPNYHPEKHLGAVEYAFLRGMQPHQTHTASPTTGLVNWQVPTTLVLALDKLFGYSSTTQP